MGGCGRGRLGDKGRDLGTKGGDLGAKVAIVGLFVVDFLGGFGELAEFVGLGG